MNRAKGGDPGFSLIELMIAMTIGLLLLSGLAMIFVNSSDANRELQKTAQQIENGRFAIEAISQDLRHAGFYGHLHDYTSITVPATVPPGPCESASAAELTKSVWFPVQGYRGTIDAIAPASDARPSGLTAACTAALLTNANLKPGSDVLVVRRADTNKLAATDVATTNVFYIQASAISAEVQIGNGAAIGTNKANGAASTLFLTNGAVPAPAAPIRKFHVHIYFVAPCSVGGAANGACTGAASEDTIPTLKRIELTSSGNMTIVPLVEGIEYFKIEFGVDTAPSAVSIATGYNGDGTVDSYKIASDVADWTQVIAAKIFLLARNTEPTTGFTDIKTYTLGSSSATDNVTVPQPTGSNAGYKRHVYSAAVHMVNPAGRREIP